MDDEPETSSGRDDMDDELETSSDENELETSSDEDVDDELDTSSDKDDYDNPWKQILEQYYEPFMAFFLPEEHATIDWSKPVTFLDKELRKVTRNAKLGNRIADKLVQVYLLSGKPTWILNHIEVQNWEEDEFEKRICISNNRLFDRYNRNVASIAVLGDTRKNWRPNRFVRHQWGTFSFFQYTIIKLFDYAKKWDVLEASDNPFATVVMAHVKTQETRNDPDERKAWKIYLMRRLYKRGASRQDIINLFAFIDWLMRLPAELEEEFRHDLEELEREQTMPYITSVERLAKEEGIQQGIAIGIEQGIEQGIERGIERGIKQGIEQGQQIELYASIELVLKLKFGEPSLELMPAIRQITALEQLRTIRDTITTVQTLKDIRRLLTPPSNGEPNPTSAT